MTAHGDDLITCRRCGALWDHRERSQCPGCVFHAERTLNVLQNFINQCRAAGIQLRVNAESMADLTDIGHVWTASHDQHHVRRPI